MTNRALLAAFVATILFVTADAWDTRAPDYRVGSISPGELPAPYAADPRDSWNRIFRALFTRDVTFRLTDEYPQAAPFSEHTGIGAFLPAHGLSQATFTRRESGDRPIAPLYPSFLSVAGLEQLLREPTYSEFLEALREAQAETIQRPPLQRALMQADLWAAFDMLFANQSAAGVRATRSDSQRAELLRQLARLIHKIALTPAEIRSLPDTYRAATNQAVPPVFQTGSGWIEVEWSLKRSHDHDAGMRTASRVFLKPRTPPADISAFLNRLRSHTDGNFAAELEASALVTEQLLIANDGTVTRSPLSIDVQIRRFLNDAHGQFERTAAEEFELSRQRLRDDPRSGFVHEAEDFPAYLSSAGNDYRFGSPAFGRQGPLLPVLATLNSRCASCHGPDPGALFTFSKLFPNQLPPPRTLPPDEDRRAAFVAGEKAGRAELKALLTSW